MSTDIWVTIVAYDTPFLAQLVTDRLDDVGIEHRTLSDSAGGNLPHISFGSGGYRVQVARQDEEAARDAIEALPDDFLDGIDVGEFQDGTDGVVPADTLRGASVATRQRWMRLAAVLVVLVVLGVFLLGPPDLFPRLVNWPPGG
ncbi:MAG: DUF2007 domain-containing protein [Nitriliruptor sp.]|nr:MAG: DUF2007 domain-containing protein [Nitriliruptor sp.]